MADKLKHPEIFIEEGTGREYKLRGCTNGGCFCTGRCREKIYLDGNNQHLDCSGRIVNYMARPAKGEQGEGR